MSKVYSLKKIQKIPANMNEVWGFFSNPANLKNITPAELNFNIISKYHGDKMYTGQIIEYTLKPLLNIPVYWMTEITHVNENKYFIDEQRFGPYSLWHHQHHFKQIDGGVEMTDIVHYKIPFWFLGDIAHSFFVQKKLNDIFDFRLHKTEEHFGRWID
ncbi:MAG TPA: SRPBCC family protein [Puia sp.]|nr:SRPBCC family protein [Puia sp.]